MTRVRGQNAPTGAGDLMAALRGRGIDVAATGEVGPRSEGGTMTWEGQAVPLVVPDRGRDRTCRELRE